MHRKGRNPRGEDVTNNRLFNGAPPRRNAGRLHRCSHSAHFKTHAHTRTHAYTHTYTHTYTLSLSLTHTHTHTWAHVPAHTNCTHPFSPLPHAHTLNAHIPLFESCCCELIIVAKKIHFPFASWMLCCCFSCARARVCVCVCCR